MDIGNKIKQLRHKSGLTQEQLASRLGVSAQAVSKWETDVTMPDITLLPMIATEFGISIDELFDLTTEQKLYRIKKRIETEYDLNEDVFKEFEEFLLVQLSVNSDRVKILSLLAHLYHHRMETDARKVSKYAREAIMLKPEVKDCQWLLQMAEGERAWDWVADNSASLIDFYKEVIKNDKIKPPTPLPYYYLLDDLIADKRTKEAREYLEILKTIPAHRAVLIPVYEANIALAEFDEKKADEIMLSALEKYENNGIFVFESAQYHARKGNFKTAIELFERAWTLEESNKPRYTDNLCSIALIYQIMGDKENAIATYDRILACLRDEWGFSKDDKPYIEVEMDKAKLKEL